MPKKLRAAVIGAGAIATHSHIPAYQALDDVEIVALCDINAARVEEEAQILGIPAWYTEYQKMLDTEAPDLVSVCSPNAFHAPMTIAALRAGAHVICEKPMALTYAQACEMVKASEETGKTLTFGFHMRSEPTSLAALQAIKSNKLGQIYYAKASYLRKSGIPGYGSWFTSKDLAGGGAMMDIGCHMLDLTLWLMGHPKPISVTASTYAEFGPRAKGLGGWGADHYGLGARFDVDDLTSAFVRFENGATMLLEASWATMGTQGQHFQLYGTEGGLELNPNLFGQDEPLHYFTESDLAENGSPVELVDTDERGHKSIIKNWIAAIRKGEQPAIKATEAAMVVKIVEAAYESARTGKQVDL